MNNKIYTAAAALIVSLASALPAAADHSLLVTDVLDARQAEFGASLEYAHNHYNAAFQGFKATTTGNFLTSSYMLGLGIGHGLQLSASVPYSFQENFKREFDDPAIGGPFYAKQDGWGDFEFGVKYNLYGNSKKSLAVATGVDVKFETASTSNFGTGTTEVNPFVAVSDVIGDNVRPYAAYRAVISNHGASDSHIIGIGAEYALSPTFTVRPNVSATFRTATEDFTAHESFALNLLSYVQLFRNFYLLPAAHVGTTTATRSKDGFATFNALTFYGAGVGLYYLYD